MEFIEQYRPWIDQNESDAVAHYINGGGYLTEFKKTQEFAQEIARYTNSSYCSIYANGTVTLVAALIALGITNKSDEVIVPDYTMIASANAVIMAGATPVFVDVERATMCLDYEDLKIRVGANTKAIMLVSINGRYPVRLQEILVFCRERNIAIIEDAAQSLGSWYDGKHVGTFGDIASFSFSMPKIITTGQGGALITNDAVLFRKVELIKNFGRETAGVDKHVFYGVNFKFTDLQAVIGLTQMKKLESCITLKKRNYKLLKERLKDLSEVEFLQTRDDVVPWFIDIIVEDPVKLQTYLKSKDIGSRTFYPEIHTQAPYCQTELTFENASFFSRHGLWLPSFPQLKEEQIEVIANAIISFYRRRTLI